MTTATDSAVLGIPPEYPPMTPELAERWQRFCEQEAEQTTAAVPNRTVLAWWDRDYKQCADKLLNDSDIADWLDNRYEELGGLVYPNIEDNREKLDGLRFFAEAMRVLKWVALLDVAERPEKLTPARAIGEPTPAAPAAPAPDDDPNDEEEPADEGHDDESQVGEGLVVSAEQQAIAATLLDDPAVRYFVDDAWQCWTAGLKSPWQDPDPQCIAAMRFLTETVSLLKWVAGRD